MEPTLSAHDCLCLYRALLLQTINQVAAWEIPGLSKSIVFTDTGIKVRPFIEGLRIPSVFSVEPQTGNDLGERMANALRKKWKAGFRKIVFIGSDCPLIRLEDIRTALQSLSKCEIVIGPATDGGYYLIGFSALKPFVFDGIHWGTNRVYQETVQKLSAHGTQWESLRERFDLDGFDDLVQFQRLLARKPFLIQSEELVLLVNRLVAQVKPKRCP
jgi:hypothetical protein